MVEQWVEVAAGIAAWYLTSFGTLLLNKHLLGTLHIQPNTLAVVQMVSTAVYGAAKTVRPGMLVRALREVGLRSGGKAHPAANGIGVGGADLEDPSSSLKKGHVVSTWQQSFAQMGFVGAMRFATVVLGLVSLKHVAASFTETIKASAPFFTVAIAYFMLGERTPPEVVVSLVPVAAGLVMVSYAELSFNIIGFSAAVATNVIECVQNVFSKRLLAREYTAAQLQFYTSLTALLLQGPLFLCLDSSGHTAGPPVAAVAAWNVTLTLTQPSDNGTTAIVTDAFPSPEFTNRTLALLWIDGVLYHLQSVVAYVVMSYLSPVTVSVVNTLKRALLIWISVMVFGNRVTPAAWVGTAVCLLGAFWYNFARQQGQQKAPDAAATARTCPGGSSQLWKPRE